MFARLKCKRADHQWEGCNCKRCGRWRDKGHDWDGRLCKKCNVRNINSPSQTHLWEGCFCKKCGVDAPTELHDWELIRQESTEQESEEWYGGHFVSMTSVTETEYYRCQICGKERQVVRTGIT